MFAAAGALVQRLVFTADQFAHASDDLTRFAQWRDVYIDNFLQTGDVTRLADRPFSATWEHAIVGDSLIAQFEGTLQQVTRNAKQVSAKPVESFCLSFSRTPAPQAMTQRGRDLVLHDGDAAFFSLSEAIDSRTHEGEARIGCSLSRSALLARIPHADDLVLAPLDPDNEALRHLRGYLQFLLKQDGIGGGSVFAAHVETTLLDLVALTLGVSRDMADAARMRGLRAARLQAILAGINAGFANPAFSPDVLAMRIGLSPRYIQDILRDTGVTFTERVLESRLQQTRRMLMSGASQRLKVSEIALACGFNDVSYFNQAFRRRFGGAPTQFRGRREV